MPSRKLIDEIVAQALAEAETKNIPIYTFALYYDDEFLALSVCIDTQENSLRAVKSMNAYSAKYFLHAIASGDLKSAALWNANGGRSFSLGDFVLVNLARTDVAGPKDDPGLFQDLLQALVRNLPVILKQAEDKNLARFFAAPVQIAMFSSFCLPPGYGFEAHLRISR